MLSNIQVMKQYLLGNAVIPELKMLQNGFNGGLVLRFKLATKSWGSKSICSISRPCRSLVMQKRQGY